MRCASIVYSMSATCIPAIISRTRITPMNGFANDRVAACVVVDVAVDGEADAGTPPPLPSRSHALLPHTVAGRQTTSARQGQGLGRQIAREFGAGAVIAGSVSKRVRLHVILLALQEVHQVQCRT